MSTLTREKRRASKPDTSSSGKSLRKPRPTSPVVADKRSAAKAKSKALAYAPNESQAGRAQSDPVLAKEVLGQFRSIFAAVRTHFARVEKAVGIGGAQVWALALIEASPGASLGEIASGMDVHQSTASNLVRLLLEAGFIESLRSGDDRRKVELSITAKGRLLLRKAPKPYTGVLPHALAALSASQLKALRTSLEVVRAQLNVEPALAKKPLATM
ncbi:MAG: MarR family transcriptional regulator [Betaproteobacteria bacterium]|nr:MarR family transcriptional regulator [Betaproteobacteria bacterium]